MDRNNITLYMENVMNMALVYTEPYLPHMYVNTYRLNRHLAAVLGRKSDTCHSLSLSDVTASVCISLVAESLCMYAIPSSSLWPSVRL